MSPHRFAGVLLLSWAISPAAIHAQTTPGTQTQKPGQAAAAKPAAATPQKTVQDEPIPPAAPDSLFPALVARVNGKPILGRDLDRRVKAELATIGNPAWANLRDDYRQDLISKHLGPLIAAELLYQKAAAAGMKAADAEVQSELSKIAKTHASDAEMNLALAKQGMDRAGLLKEIERNLIVNKFIQENATKKVTVTPADLSDYYSKHTEDFRHPDIVRTSEITIVLKDGATDAEDQAAKKKAEALLARARKGEDFAKLARENSMDSSAAQGGDIGWVASGDTAPEYEQAAFALDVGAISDVVRTSDGYYIIKVTGKKKAGLDTLDQVRTELTDFLKAQKNQEEVGKLVEGLRAQAKIEVLLPAGSLPASDGAKPPHQ